MESALIIVPCGKGKIWDKQPGLGPVQAQDAYIGAPFKVNRRYAERFANRWVILSAKYGFLDPATEIPGPYNVTFKKKSTLPITVPELQQQVKDQGLYHHARVVGLGGKEYRERTQQAFSLWPVQLEFPFAGPRQGEAMRAIKQAIAVATSYGY